ncbi:MAG: helix-turn-helix domain-containing protein [Dongiaceae bacterium]
MRGLPGLAKLDSAAASCGLVPLPASRAGVTAIPLIRAAALHALPEILDRAGLMLAGSFPSQLQERGGPALVPLHPVLTLLARAAAMSDDPGIGVRLAEAGGLAALGDLGRHIRGAATLREAIERTEAGIQWLLPGARLRLGREGPWLLWQAELPPRLGGDGAVARPWLLALLRLVLRAAAGSAWRPVTLRSEHGRRLESAFGQPVIEDAVVTGLTFPAGLLQLAMPGPRTGSELAAVLEATRAPADFAGSLRVLIRSLLSETTVDAAEVARLAGISLRSLQRSLAAGGLSFSELLREARLERAIELMRHPAQRMTDIGLELGYSDAANFTRAFRRWTGCSPRAYRRRLMQEAA